ncbi:tRNA threonylcarbamoyladenosine biosynthesis protein TsaB [Vibrio aerogenes CECT 7868]|uniref:tRNA threonylcarbamoyladenosine biosynthesis protein TsaB n=1 Tax=Vibrio aerogenes CECT 7868 TaxID=1216006 RepID=A0A1M6BRM4_9VIBR|nr:tRNA (adenosine(37)-N6)-threonylcarbamoyltransferase complex dimerization subunit type 1 TsaB [Vibrio aerogenes]SHI51233.1 tRNA threonylcarbamoyladenosine biosynthesis protein TsaB [Vibrio aerogenes CECT 7868]
MSVKILAIDTSTEHCSVALVVHSQWFVRREVSPRGHAQKILPMVDEVLKESGMTLNELDALAFGRGPGSFTGVRIGVGITQGLAFGAALPVIPVSTLEAMAQGAYRQAGATLVAAAIDARMSEVYWGRYRRQEDGGWQALESECVIAPEILVSQMNSEPESWYGAGTGWQAYQGELSGLPFRVDPGDVLYPDAEDIAFLATLAWQRGETVKAEEASPVYLRDQVAWKKLPGRT